ncbi:MAG: TlpA family protein disulfide reductase [Bacteroides sp.]|nr:TlpA family protein disulfide reductase [Bacteroides sp.]MCM1084719.1 TlpA family protein disulfide reductase [Bacteroides sp.]
MKRYLLSCLALLLGAGVFAPLRSANDGYEIRVRIKNYPDSLKNEIYLGYYNWQSQYIADTARYDAKTKSYLFKGNEAKPGGMYMLITSDKRYVDFIFDQDQHIEIEANYPDLFDGIKFRNSPENEAYQAFAAIGTADYRKMNQLQKDYKEAEAEENKSKMDGLREQSEQLRKKMEDDREQFMQENPGNLMAAIFKAQKDVHVPDAPESVPDSLAANWQYEYYKNHYFENFDPCDDRLIRTPLVHQRIKSFHEKVLNMQSPDSIKYAWERQIERARCDSGKGEFFKYLIWYPVDAYQRSEIIGQDAVWVYLAKKYYLGGDAYWASKSIVENFRKRIERVEPLLIGNRPLEFYCPDTTIASKGDQHDWVSVFSSPKRYSVIIFWSTSCGHCRTAMPQWHQLYLDKKDVLDFEVFAICKDFDVPEWMKYIKDHNLTAWINLNGKESNLDYNDAWDITTTPTVYVLDREKRIVTKKIDSAYLRDFILNWQETYYPDEAPLDQ